MIHPIRARLATEFDKFNVLSAKTQNLLISYFVQSAANPILGTFMNAYLWSIGGDFYAIAVFNLATFISLPLTFFVNGMLLRFISIDMLYTLGSLTLGIDVLLTILLTKMGIYSYTLFGAIFGVGYGLYWANRNYLTLKQTKSHNRNYFLGLNFTLDTLTSIVMPLFIGWFIYFGSRVNLETYTINALLAFTLLLIAGILVIKGGHKTPSVDTLFPKDVSKKWHVVRLLTFGIGLLDGLSAFLVSLLVLAGIGHEGTLGTVDSVTAIFLGILFYIYGRKARVHHQKTTYVFSVSIGIVASIFLLFGVKEALGVIVFTALYYFSIAFIWLSTDPMVMDIMDEEINKKHGNRYCLVFDRELFLNIGRWLSVGIFISLLSLYGQRVAVSMAPGITFLLHFLVMLVVLRALKANSIRGIDN